MADDNSRYVMRSGAVAKRLDRSQSSVYDLDGVLRPIRSGSGQRLYDPQVVEQYLASRGLQK